MRNGLTPYTKADIQNTPVCDETVDKIIGVLDVKDFFRLSNEPKERILKDAVKPAYSCLKVFMRTYFSNR